MENILELRTVHTGSLTLGEGPIWDERIQTLYFVDILQKTLYRWNYASKETRVKIFEEYISCIALSEDEGLILIALESGVFSYALDTESLSFICKPESQNNFRYNDGRVDWNGSWLLGSMNNLNNGPDAPLLPDATLYKVEGTTVTSLLKGVTISNGIAFRKPYIYFIDSKLNCIRKFVYDQEQFTLIKEIFKLEDGTTLDGMCISADNKIFIANWAGSKIIVFDLLKEHIISTIPLPCLNPTSCTFGGPDMNELFITTASINENNTAVAGVYAIRLNEHGVPENKIKLKNLKNEN